MLGLILHSDAADTEQEKNIQLELAKRTLQKLGMPVGEAQLASNHKQLLMIVYQRMGDLSGLVETAKLFTPYDPSDDKKVMIKALIELKDYAKALESAQKLIKSSSSLDFEVWKMILDIPDCLEIVSSQFFPLLENLHSADARGIKLAKIYLDLRFRLTDNLHFSQSLLNFVVEMRSKGSMVFDVIEVLGELNSEMSHSFASLLQAYLDSVRSY